MDTDITRNFVQRTLIPASLLFFIPLLHPLLIPVMGMTSHLLWWVHVAPVASLSYLYGARGATVAISGSAALVVIGERLFGAGYGSPAAWETALALGVSLAMTNLMVAVFAIYAGRAAEQLRFAAYTHPLTHLPSREYLERAITRIQKDSRRPHALLFIDIDDFDTINYSLGHVAGDAVLVELASRLRACVTEDQVLAHWVGDKFAIYFPAASEEEVEALVGRVRDALSQPLNIQGLTLRALSAGIGIAREAPGCNASQLSQNASTALSHAKKGGPAGWCQFNRTMREEAEQRLSMLNDLMSAIEQGQLQNHYQPIHEAGSGRVAGMEALVRWRHPDKGMISPAEFIPLAEQAGMIARLGEVVMLQAMRDFHQWRDMGLCGAGHFMNINISPLQLLEPCFMEKLAASASHCHLNPASLVFEITETEMMQSETVSLRILKALTEGGFRIAIDDFGSGYSSFNYLHKLPVQILKIDRVLVDQLTRSDRPPLVRPIVEIARALELHVIAEGVETREQAEQLAALSVDYLQGFFLSRPMPAGQITTLLRGNSSMNAGVPADEEELTSRTTPDGK